MNQAPSNEAKNLDEILSVAFSVPLGDPRNPACQWGLPTILVGDPGIGKSGRIKAIGTRLGLEHTYTIAAPTKQPEDFSGMPIVTDGRVEFITMLPEVHILMGSRAGVLFIDELGSAPPPTQAAALGLIQDGVIAGQALAPRIRRICAMNPVRTAASGWGLEAPMANRLCHVPCATPLPNEWAAYMMGFRLELPPCDASEAIVQARWDSSWNAVWPSVAGFVQSRPGSLNGITKEGGSGAWASPRTWDWATHMLVTCHAVQASETTRATLLVGLIGGGLASEYLAFTKENRLPHPQEVLSGAWRPGAIFQLDVCIAAYTAMTLFVTQSPDRRQLEATAWRRLGEFWKEGGMDQTLPLVAMLATKDARTIPEALDLLANIDKAGLGPYLTKAVGRAGA